MMKMAQTLMNNNVQFSTQVKDLDKTTDQLNEQSGRAIRYINDIGMKAAALQQEPDQYIASLNNPQVQKEYLDMVATAGAAKQTLAALAAQKQQLIQRQQENQSLAVQMGMKATGPSGKASPAQTNALVQPSTRKQFRNNKTGQLQNFVLKDGKWVPE